MPTNELTIDAILDQTQVFRYTPFWIPLVTKVHCCLYRNDGILSSYQLTVEPWCPGKKTTLSKWRENAIPTYRNTLSLFNTSSALSLPVASWALPVTLCTLIANTRMRRQYNQVATGLVHMIPSIMFCMSLCIKSFTLLHNLGAVPCDVTTTDINALANYYIHQQLHQSSSSYISSLWLPTDEGTLGNQESHQNFHHILTRTCEWQCTFCLIRKPLLKQ